MINVPNSKILFISVWLLGAGLMLSGCENGDGEASSEYGRITSLDNVVEASQIIDEGSFSEIESTEQTDSFEPGEAEASGSEEKNIGTVIKKASIYNKPAKDSSVLGTLKKGDEISYIEALEDGKWMKIIYNGRIAYIMSDYIEIASEEENESNTEEYSEDSRSVEQRRGSTSLENSESDTSTSLSTETNTSSPSTEERVITEQPTTVDPVTEQPIIVDPVTEEPTTEQQPVLVPPASTEQQQTDPIPDENINQPDEPGD